MGGKAVQIITLTPTRGLLFTESVSALELELLRNKQFGFPIRTNGVPLPESRNQLVEMALKEKYWTHALLVDDDVVIPDGGLKKMIDLDADIAVIDYSTHISTFEDDKQVFLGVTVFEQWKPGQSTKGKKPMWSGLGCALVKREVFEKMEKPWFAESAYIYKRDEDGKLVVLDEQAELESDEQKGAGEDTYFILKAKKLGYELKVVEGMVCRHLFLEMAVPRMANHRYRRSHRISSKDKVDRPMV